MLIEVKRIVDDQGVARILVRCSHQARRTSKMTVLHESFSPEVCWRKALPAEIRRRLLACDAYLKPGESSLSNGLVTPVGSAENESPDLDDQFGGPASARWLASWTPGRIASTSMRTSCSTLTSHLSFDR